jgi:hypothetical protein
MTTIIRVITVIFLCLITGFASGQGVLHIQLLNATDSTPVVGAHLLSAAGRVLATSNRAGMATIADPIAGASIAITHVAYRDTILYLPEPGKRQVCYNLMPETTALKAFSVYASPVNLLPEKPWFIADYIHTAHGILLLAYPQRRLENQSLYLLNEDEQVVTARSWNEQGNLVADATGGIWLKGKNTTWRILVFHDELIVGAEVLPTRDFESGLERIQLVVGDRYYFHHFSHDNQWVDLYCYNAMEQSTQMVECAYDPLGLVLRETRHIFEESEFDRRFADMCFFKPVYAPVHKVEDQIIFFNFAEGMLMFFDTLNQPLGETAIFFHKDRGFRQSLLNDPVTKRFYALFELRGITTVREINLADGTLSDPIEIPGYPFVDQISVYNNQIYFLYKEETFHEYKKIFRMSIPCSRRALTVDLE